MMHVNADGHWEAVLLGAVFHVCSTLVLELISTQARAVSGIFQYLQVLVDVTCHHSLQQLSCMMVEQEMVVHTTASQR